MPRSSPILPALLLWCSIATAAAAAAAADPIFPPGSRIGLAPPPGMVPSTRFQGFEDAARNAVILVTELTAQTYPKIEAEFTAESLRRDGFEIRSREDFRDRRGFLVVATQTVAGVQLRKWAQVVVADEVTAIVIAVLPESALDAYSDAVIAEALKSFTLRPKLSAAELLAVLPYRLRELAGFRPLSATPDGTVVLTSGEADSSLPAEQPFFMIARRLGPVPQLAEQERFARRVLAQFVGLADFRFTQSQSLKLGGQPAHEIVGETPDKATGTALVAVQWLRFGMSGYVQMFGMARKDVWDAVHPRMRALRDGLEEK